MKEIIGYANSEISVLVVCPHCGKIHGHGREVPGGVNLGHRVADCADPHNEGYLIIAVEPLDQMPPIRTEKRRKLRAVQ